VYQETLIGPKPKVIINPRSELTSANMSTNAFSWQYDPIGNHSSASNDSETIKYLANALNQYTNISDGVTNIPVHDADGNLVSSGGWTFTWDAENRLIGASNVLGSYYLGI
jgi:hypothetical protein